MAGTTVAKREIIVVVNQQDRQVEIEEDSNETTESTLKMK